MFCPNCGTQVSDTSKFCPSCGNSMAAQPPQQEPTYSAPSQNQQPPAYSAPQYQQPPVYTQPTPPQQPYAGYQQPAYSAPGYGTAVYTPKKSKKPLIIIIAIVVVVAIVAALFLFVIGGGIFRGGYKDYNKLIGDYFTAASKNDTKAIINMMLPEMRDLWKEMGMGDERALLDEMDYWTDNYGMAVMSWSINQIDEYDAEDALDFTAYLRIKPTQYVDIEVNADYGYTYDTFDFDLVLVNGRWYIIEIW